MSEVQLQDDELAHAFDAAQVLARLGSSEEGLSDTEVLRRRQLVGENRLPMTPQRPWWRRLLGQFDNVLLYVLMVAAFAAALLGHGTDALVIMAVVVINALVGFIQEGRAEAALRGILAMVVSETLVRREGQLRQVPVMQLVPGDIVIINPGDRLPADMRLLESRDLRCDEAALTGESVPVAKDPAAVAVDAPLAERSGCVYMGTQVTFGSGVGVVIATGVHTQLGRIGEMVSAVTIPTTPLTRQLQEFGRSLSLVILAVTLLAVPWGVLVSGLGWEEMFRAAVGIAVAAIPEGLPAIVTITLAMGVQRMARARAVVRKLPAVEVLGAVTVICSDKTGTLTRNEMTARRLITAEHDFSITGEGYAPAGAVELEGKPVTAHGPRVLQQAARAALFCNDANVEEKDGIWLLHGDPTEGALHVFARKTGLLSGGSSQGWRRIDAIPFTTEQRYMAVLGHGVAREASIFVKGAPERILSFCDRQLEEQGAQPLNPEYWQHALDTLARNGSRVMALAMSPHDPEDAILTADEVESGLIFLGLVGITDPPRQEAADAIAQCRRAGINVKMITGDNPRTAGAIGEQLGLEGSRVLTGADLDALDDRALAQEVQRTEVFARTSPAHKLRLVEALLAQGQVVAMTGDGVNDAPALRQANIGVAMGRKGTDAAREASAMVLTDDNFATIVHAVKEGRTVYDNIVKAILFILPTSLVEASALLVAILLGVALPITAVQVLWVNMITAVTLAFALAFEPAEPDLMKRAPRRPDAGLISTLLVRRLVLVGFVGTVAVFWMFSRFRDELALAQTLAVTTLVFMETFYLFNCRRLHVQAWENHAWRGVAPALLASLSVLALQWLFTALPVMQQVFGTVELSGPQWLLAALAGGAVAVVVELDKFQQALRHGLGRSGEEVMHES